MAVERNECRCDTCRSYCHRVPGWFAPHEVGPAAALLGLTVEEFAKKYLTIDYWMGSGELDETFTLRPSSSAEEPGEVAPYDPRGKCVFLTSEDLCQIHAAKPHECATAKHDVAWPSGFHLQTAKMWTTDEAKSLVRQCYDGCDPVVPDADFGDMLAAMGRW